MTHSTQSPARRIRCRNRFTRTKYHPLISHDAKRDDPTKLSFAGAIDESMVEIGLFDSITFSYNAQYIGLIWQESFEFSHRQYFP